MDCDAKKSCETQKLRRCEHLAFPFYKQPDFPVAS